MILKLTLSEAERYFGYRTRAEMLADYQASKDLNDLGHELAAKMHNLEYQVTKFDNSYYKKFYDETHKEWKELYGTSYVDLRSLPTTNGISLSDLENLKYKAQNIARNANAILKELEGGKDETDTI